jgi:hypothetical protein
MASLLKEANDIRERSVEYGIPLNQKKKAIAMTSGCKLCACMPMVRDFAKLRAN